MSKLLPALAAVALVAVAPVAGADVLIIEKLEAARADLPTRGTSMDAVERRFGAPQRISGPVGDPPITRWDYPDFVVVFEYRLVIHSVQKHDRPPRPAN